MLMNEDRNVDPIADLLSQHALQGLDAEGEAQLQRLLSEDPALARESEELRRVVELLPLVTQCAPPAHLRARVLSAARAAAAPPVRVDHVRSIKPKRWPLVASATLAAAASLTCAVLIASLVRVDHERDSLTKANESLKRELDLKSKAASMLLEPNIVMAFSLDGLSAAAHASGYVLLDLDARRASIAVLDLPPAPAGHSYHLWAVLESKKVPCGRFTPAPDGRILTQFSIPVDSYTSPIERLILTVEPDSEQTTPRGTTVMTS